MADKPRSKEGVIPPEWFDNEPSPISEEEQKKSYSDEFRKWLDDYEQELDDLINE